MAIFCPVCANAKPEGLSPHFGTEAEFVEHPRDAHRRIVFATAPFSSHIRTAAISMCNRKRSSPGSAALVAHRRAPACPALYGRQRGVSTTFSAPGSAARANASGAAESG